MLRVRKLGNTCQWHERENWSLPKYLNSILYMKSVRVDYLSHSDYTFICKIPLTTLQENTIRFQYICSVDERKCFIWLHLYYSLNLAEQAFVYYTLYLIVFC